MTEQNNSNSPSDHLQQLESLNITPEEKLQILRVLKERYVKMNTIVNGLRETAKVERSKLGQ